MTVFQYAIICAANSLKPGKDGYQEAQRWKREIVERLEAEQIQRDAQKIARRRN